MASPAFNNFVWQVWHWDALKFTMPKLSENQKFVLQKRSKWKVHCVHFVWPLWHWTGLKSIGFNSLAVLLSVPLLLGCKAGLIKLRLNWGTLKKLFLNCPIKLKLVMLDHGRDGWDVGAKKNCTSIALLGSCGLCWTMARIGGTEAH